MNIFSGWDSHALEKKKLGLPFDFKLVARHGYFVWHDLFHNLSGLRTFRSILLTSLRRKVAKYHITSKSIFFVGRIRQMHCWW